MRKCPDCGKTYDDTWKVCLVDGAALKEVTGKETVGDKIQETTIKTRPVGIIVIAILLLLAGLSGIFSLAGLFMPPSSPAMNAERFREQALKMRPNATEKDKADLEKTLNSPSFQDMQKAQYDFLKSGRYRIMALSSGILGLIALIAGIGLLKSKEWARKLAIVVQLLSIAVYGLSIYVSVSSFKSATEHMPQAKQFFPVMIGIQAVVGAIIMWAIVSYLCRPQVKKWFA